MFGLTGRHRSIADRLARVDEPRSLSNCLKGSVPLDILQVNSDLPLDPLGHGEALDGEELTNYFQAQDVIGKIMDWYNEERLHSALGFLRPVDYYRGEPEVRYEDRRRKLAHARHRRREENLRLRQRTLPLESAEVVA